MFALPEWKGEPHIPRFNVDTQLAASIERNLPHRAVVLFRFSDSATEHDEPVFNSQAAWPDDEKMVRAHDFGRERDRQIIAYYAARQPDRVFYLFVRADHRLCRLGTAAELIKNGWPTGAP